MEIAEARVELSKSQLQVQLLQQLLGRAIIELRRCPALGQTEA